MASALVKEVKDLRTEKNDNDGVDDKPSATPEFNDEMLPIHYYQLTPALEEEARTQLKETEEKKKMCLIELRNLIKSEKKLFTPTDDNFLLAFLRARKFNVKKAFSLLKSFWSFRKQHKKIFDSGGLTEEVKSLLLRSYLGLLLSRDKNGCAVFVFKIALWDPDIDSYETLFLAISGALVYCLEHPATHIAGFRAIIDLRGMGWKQMRYFTPGNALLLIRSTQFSFPARFKGVHILCENRMIKCCWNLLYPFLTSKLKNRTFFHGEDLSPIREYIHPSVLSSEFGGEGPRFDNSSWPAIWKIIDPKIDEMNKCGYRD